MLCQMAQSGQIQNKVNKKKKIGHQIIYILQCTYFTSVDSADIGCQLVLDTVLCVGRKS